MNGALDIKVLEVTAISSDSINAQSTLDLFKKLEEKYSLAQRIVVLCDNIERLWRFMNEKVRNNRYYEKFLDFKTAIYAFFENISKYREELQSLLSKRFSLVKS